MIKGIVFDMDGLMFDTERLVVKAWNDAGKQFGYQITEDIVVKTLGLNVENTKQVFLQHFGDDFDFSAIRERRVTYVTEYIENNGMPVKPGLYELLDYLTSRNYQITVATSTERKKAHYYFEKAGIDRYFNEIVCGDMVKRGKPEPDIYLKACEVIGVDPSECFALEDAPLGILSAHRAGLKAVMIPDLVKPDEQTKKIIFAEVSTLFGVIDLLEQDDE
jgi:HAD superfamily hydrolase (TIGR01509 family)